MILYKRLKYYKYNKVLKKDILHISVLDTEHFNKVSQAKKESGLIK